MQQSRLREVGAEDFDQQQAPATDQQQANASLALLLLALKTLGQRTIVALAALRGLILAGAVFGLALKIEENPTTDKLVGLGIFAGFVLLLELMARRK